MASVKPVAGRLAAEQCVNIDMRRGRPVAGRKLDAVEPKADCGIEHRL